MKIIDTDTRLKIIELYKEKVPVVKIKNNLGIGIRIIYRIIEEEGIEIKRKKRKLIKGPKYDLSGKKFFHLYVEKMAQTPKSKSGTWRCICLCDCGRICDRVPSVLMNDQVKTCGNTDCIYHRQDYSNSGKNNVKFTGYEGILGSKWSSYKCGARRRNLTFDVNIKDAWDLFLSQEKKCALTGLNISFGRTNTDFKNSTASLDRIDSNKGYTLDNVMWVHKKINTMKWDLDINEFISLCEKVVKNKLK